MVTVNLAYLLVIGTIQVIIDFFCWKLTGWKVIFFINSMLGLIPPLLWFFYARTLTPMEGVLSIAPFLEEWVPNYAFGELMNALTMPLSYALSQMTGGKYEAGI
ncbi:MAG: hypothetical protein NTV61_03110 [Candidatus Bathyarchaeota archaeon]|nr:hypothetical protein [Candidatus Bathyarchaeota archaeon]